MATSANMARRRGFGAAGDRDGEVAAVRRGARSETKFGHGVGEEEEEGCDCVRGRGGGVDGEGCFD